MNGDDPMTDTDLVLDKVQRDGDFTDDGGYLGERDWEFALAADDSEAA